MLLRYAEKNKDILGVIGWVDIRNKNLKKELKKIENNYLFGFRDYNQTEFLLDE